MRQSPRSCMNESVLTENSTENGAAANPRKPVSILGVPLRYGADMVGVELGPAVMRMAGLESRIADLGYEVQDHGDIVPDRVERSPAEHDRLKYLHEISSTCQRLCRSVKISLDKRELPIILRCD